MTQLAQPQWRIVLLEKDLLRQWCFPAATAAAC